MSGAWIQSRRAGDVVSCVYQLVVSELVFKYNVRYIPHFLRAFLRKGAIHTYTTAARSMEGTASFFNHLLDLNKKISAVSFKFKFARCSKHADSKCADESTLRCL